MLFKKFYCPVNGWDCPYYKKDGSCLMAERGYDPVKECDDAGTFWEENEDYFVWMDDSTGEIFERAELLEKGYHFINDEPIDREMWEKFLAYKKRIRVLTE